MANKILIGSTYYGEIRGRLGVSISELLDTDIDARSVMNIAENRVIESVPDYATLNDVDSDYVYTAAICMVAAILAPSMGSRLKKSKKDFDSSFENQDINWQQRGIELLTDCYEAIGNISTQAAPTNLDFMGLAGPTRAKADCIPVPTIYSGDIYLNNV